jgi:hypothetical protein
MSSRPTNLAGLDLGRLVVDRQQEVRAVEQLLDRRLLLRLVLPWLPVTRGS